jgi:hypothetical protein
MSKKFSLISDDAYKVSMPSIISKLADKNIAYDSRASALSFVARKAEISGRLFKAYDQNGIKATQEICSVDELLLAAELLASAISDPATESNSVEKLKWINAAYKLMERAGSLSDFHSTERSYLWIQLNQVLKKVVDGFIHIEKCTPLAVAPAQPVFRTAPITVLFWESPIARAYLATLRDCGYKPQRIINLVADVDIANGKTLLPWLPQIIRAPYCKVVHQSRAHHWSRYIIRHHPNFFLAIKNSIVKDFNFRGECYEEAQITLPLSEYCEDVQDIVIENLNDRRLAKVLSKEVGTVLFTGGGIVPKFCLISLT